ncbi:Kinesin light chain 3 [Rhizophlyctis rosea]|nr:Kinesin light chain 3 [Rhizophlyctis rosea]
MLRLGFEKADEHEWDSVIAAINTIGEDVVAAKVGALTGKTPLPVTLPSQDLQTEEVEESPVQLAPVPTLGVRLSFLVHQFVESCGGRYTLKGLSTSHICDSFINPRTAASESFCDHLLSVTTECPDPSLVAPAEWFISHSWQYLFLDLIDAINAFFLEKDNPDPVLWIDLVSLPQSGRQQIGVEWLKTAFMDAITTIKDVLMVWSPWDRPITLSRAWCVYEIYACKHVGRNFDIALPPSELAAYKESLLQNPNDVIRTTVGFANLDRLVDNSIFKIVTQTLRSYADQTRKPETHSEHVQWLKRLGDVCFGKSYANDGAAPALLGALEDSQRGLREDSECTLALMHLAAQMYVYKGPFEEAEKLHVQCGEGLRGLLGEDHPASMISTHGLASLFTRCQEYDRAEALIANCMGRAHKITSSIVMKANIVGGSVEEVSGPDVDKSLLPLEELTPTSVLGNQHWAVAEIDDYFGLLHPAECNYPERMRLAYIKLGMLQGVLIIIIQLRLTSLPDWEVIVGAEGWRMDMFK